MSPGPPAPITKAYLPRGRLSQFQLERAMPFACFRCGLAKKAKLQTIYDGDWSRRLCNGCYGYLLSIYEVAAGATTEDEKATQLALLVLDLVSADDARGALRRRSYGRDPQACLSPEAARFLGTAEFVAEQLRRRAETLEWSSASSNRSADAAQTPTSPLTSTTKIWDASRVGAPEPKRARRSWAPCDAS
jgi:hypothetical protein